jgi:hypothetical protein
MYYSVRYHEGDPPHIRPGTQLIHADSDAAAKKIAAEVCRPGRYNGKTRRVIVSIDPVR